MKMIQLQDTEGEEFAETQEMAIEKVPCSETMAFENYMKMLQLEDTNP